MKNATPEIGMAVFLRPTIHNHTKRVLEGTLTKIGHKYYTVVSHHQEYRFHVDSKGEASGYCSNYDLYFSKEDLDDAVERDELLLQMSRLFQLSSRENKTLTLDQLRQIAKITNIVPQPELKDFTVCFEMSGGITVKAETAEQAESIFDGMNVYEVFEHANPTVVTGVYENKDDVPDTDNDETEGN